MSESPTALEQCIEAMARAYYEWCCGVDGEESRWDEPDDAGRYAHKVFARSRAEVMFDALLRVPYKQPCATCGGTGNERWVVQATDGLGNVVEIPLHDGWRDCPDCPPRVSALLQLLRETGTS